MFTIIIKLLDYLSGGWISLGCLTFVVILVSVFFLGRSCNENDVKGIETENDRLELIIDEINEAVKVLDFEKAETLANQLQWKYLDEKKELDEKKVDSWNKKREKKILEIKKLRDRTSSMEKEKGGIIEKIKDLFN
jgi:hypothetical protein